MNLFEIAQLQFPTTTVKDCYHIGTLEPDHNEGNSYEGEGLSVTNRPDAWVRIARLGGRPLWRLVKPENRFLDNKKLTDEHRVIMHKWAVEQGLVSGEDMTDKMIDRMKTPGATTHPHIYIKGFIAVAYAEDVLGLDGVWWAVPTRGMNAPRGVIHSSKLGEWLPEKVEDEYYG